jgi:hypothetical protein
VGKHLSGSITLIDNAYYYLAHIRDEKMKLKEVPDVDGDEDEELRPLVPLSTMNAVIYACAHLRAVDRSFATYEELKSFGRKRRKKNKLKIKLKSKQTFFFITFFFLTSFFVLNIFL